jgi:hypothetical protein
MEENKMQAVAQLFGKKLGEKFRVKDLQGQVKESIFSFESCGLMWWNNGKSGNSLIFMDGVLCDLLAHRAVIVDEDRR